MVSAPILQARIVPRSTARFSAPHCTLTGNVAIVRAWRDTV